MVLTVQRRLASPGTHLCGLAWDGGALCHSDVDTEAVYQVDPGEGRILRKLVYPGVLDTGTGEEIARFALPGHRRICVMTASSSGLITSPIAKFVPSAYRNCECRLVHPRENGRISCLVADLIRGEALYWDPEAVVHASTGGLPKE